MKQLWYLIPFVIAVMTGGHLFPDKKQHTAVRYILAFIAAVTFLGFIQGVPKDTLLNIVSYFDEQLSPDDQAFLNTIEQEGVVEPVYIEDENTPGTYSQPQPYTQDAVTITDDQAFLNTIERKGVVDPVYLDR